MVKTYEVQEHDGRYFILQTNSRARFSPFFESFDDRASAEARLGEVREQEDERQATLRRRREERTAERSARRQSIRDLLSVGSVLYTCWGYGQTNVEFYEVVDTHGKFGVTLREIASRQLRATGPFSAEVAPVPGEYIGEPLRKLVTDYGVKISESAHATPANGRESFHRSWGH